VTLPFRPLPARELRALLMARGLAPRHHLGQNFLVDPGLAAALVRDAGVGPGDRVLEVGPGAGALTAGLLAAGAAVLAVELDRGLVALLAERLAPILDPLPATPAPGRLVLVQGDVLARAEALHPAAEAFLAAAPPARVVANLPYGISGPFLARLPGRPVAGASLLLQREVARKAAAAPGGRDYGPLAVRLGLAFRVRLGRSVPPEAFWPRPEVRSALLHLERRPEAPAPEVDRRLAELLRLAFGQRRKRLLPRLERERPAAAAALAAAGVAPELRPEAVVPEAWLAAALAL